ncbi:Stk1 family PASTA domain-containing Ser/Thr kinase [Cellulomonas oligotrophica]|uniref:non-specific serine/threonine protein kinase n=1 Tax=Cellulomonas oligotrophica TaxID=931536 RepID=A0ABQ4DF38_9CELL|nr:Stk1 family PASTA domain-containing Ser/Thr kinase [Cellulomonas oligotrophica]GIG34341.1 protein kinase [Cellulomonas oligotrophica]
MVDHASRILAARYEVGELIGRGGMAEVHIGHDTRLGRTVAIKILRSDLARDPSFQNRFRREAQSAAALNHPAIVAVYDTGEDVITEPTGVVSHVPFIVMEYVEGHTVRDILRDGHAVPIEEAVEIAAGVLSALEYSHHAGIVHRDIKPANVMITPTGAVKVMDFGIARAVADSAATMTQTQAVIGTAQYLSPEQARGEQVDARSDLYSSGCLLFEMLTGRPPFIGDSPVAVAYQHVREIPPVPSSIASDVPETLDRITLKALAKERDARYSSAAEFRADLEAMLRGQAVGAPAVGAAVAPLGGAETTQLMAPLPAADATQAMPPAMQPWGGTQLATATTDGEDDEDENKRPWLVWVLSIIAVLAVVGIIWMLVQGNQPEEPETIAVPDVVEMEYDDAVAELTALGFETRRAEAADDSVAEGLVVSTDPEAGAQAEDGDVVVVTVSTGPGSVEVTDVAGLTEQQARAALEAQGLVVSVEQRDDPSVDGGTALATEPAAGQTAEPGQQVTLFVASGNVSVPNVVGKNIEVAQEELSALGLSVNSSPVESRDQPEGNVVSQDRAEGDVVPRGTTINLGVAEAPSTAAVPTNLVEMTYEQAVRELQNAGLNNIRRQDQDGTSYPRNTVTAVSPQGGTEVGLNQEIVLYVSTGNNGGGETTPPAEGDGEDTGWPW